MARPGRQESIDPLEIQMIHVWNRCVRRSYLCGLDPLTGIDYDYRRQWARDRLEYLASIFAIDCVTFSIMSNHTHQVLRTRPDIVETWDDETVARRWLRLRAKRDQAGNAREPTTKAIAKLVNDAKKLVTIRVRLSDVSWWMRYFSQHISYWCNREEDITGHFWEARFGSEVLDSDISTLACLVYVDLNPIRAEMAASPEEADYTGAKDRIDDLRVELAIGSDGQPSLTLTSSEYSVHDWERLDNNRSGWMCPIEIDEANDPIGADPEPNGRRASRKGVYAISLARYLELLDWVGRQLRSDKRGVIPGGLAPILERLGITAKSFFDSLLNFGKPSFFRTSSKSPADPAPAMDRASPVGG